jgi:hypothetical protein
MAYGEEYIMKKDSKQLTSKKGAVRKEAMLRLQEKGLPESIQLLMKHRLLVFCMSYRCTR